MRPCTIDVTFSHFKRCCKRAAKRHRSFPSELNRILSEIEQDVLSHGDRIPGFGATMHIRKIRIGAPDDRIPASGGYRLILHVFEVAGESTARCLDLYYKPDQADITPPEILKLTAQAADADQEQ